MSGLDVRLANCCHPLPGEAIIGYVTRGRGVTVHRADCSNVINRDEADRLIQANWGDETPTYGVPIMVKAWNRSGLLRDITSIVASEGINISTTTTISNEKNPVAVILLTLHVRDAQQLTRQLDRIGGVPNVFEVERLRSDRGPVTAESLNLNGKTRQQRRHA